MHPRNGNNDFEHAMLAHSDAAYNLARWIVRDAVLAEDVVQDAYERAFKYYTKFRGGSGRAWLLQIVRHTACSALEAARRRMEVPLVGPGDEGDGSASHSTLVDSKPGPCASLERKQEIRHLQTVLESMPYAWRECLMLREVEALSYKEIARIVDIPVGTVMSRLSRARQALSRLAAQEPSGPVDAAMRLP